MFLSLLAAAAPASLTFEGGLSIAVVATVFATLMLRRSSPVELLFLSGLAVVTLAGAIPAKDALAGFASGPVLLIGALFAAAAGLQTTGAVDWIGGLLLGQAKTERQALRRLALATPISAFLINTPLVAMLAPVVIDWCRKNSVSPSRLMMPLSHLVILGGVCTVIGTSTTLVCNAQIAEVRDDVQQQYEAGEVTEQFLADVGDIRFFEITWVGVPIALAGVAYILFLAPRRLPNRTDLLEDFGDRRREYLVEMLVQPGCGLVGKTVEQAGLRQLPGLFLIEISRGEEVITPIAPGDLIYAHDRMVFTGVVGTIADLERIPGLVPAADITYESRPAERTRRHLAEAVLSRTSPINGRTVREANFRQLYNAAIVAVHRGGERLGTKIGDIRLQPGDTLLLQTRSGFVEAHRNSRDFYLVSQVGGSSARRHDRAPAAILLFVLLLAWLVATSVGAAGSTTAAWLSPNIRPIAGIAVVMAMIGARCLTLGQARAAIDLQVLITVAAAIGLGGALSHSGAAQWVANLVVNTVQLTPVPANVLPWVLLAAVYLLSMGMTEAITNAAVATIMIPISVGIAQQAGLSPRPFLMAVAIAASLSFATPVGYQTNLMVMGPGGYHPKDYLRVGGPLQLMIALIGIITIGLVWPLEGFDARG
ncbi:SLC13 family permease [Botrimarina mediterranea]|uniref:Citrate transporter n=1 Tax=Botrimarina mediterranea TaxID=2528022 RepID=A0A518K414_9BACT|nr:SLC13 family permease [Botrimarina mediterranea]QDV72548.1 Citrate transporter [Botrimarina mediterranea]QDV77120.1 Citrate transporter [Planctomycetes bacterium K2D]